MADCLGRIRVFHTIVVWFPHRGMEDVAIEVEVDIALNTGSRNWIIWVKVIEENGVIDILLLWVDCPDVNGCTCEKKESDPDNDNKNLKDCFLT